MIKGYLIAAAAGLALSVATYVLGRVDGAKIKEADELQRQALVREAAEAMIDASARQIAKIEVRHQTIRQEVIHDVIEKPVYRDCRHDGDTLRLLNDALQNRDPQPSGSGVLPTPDPPS